MFASGETALQDQFWTKHDILIGKICDYECLPWRKIGRMGRIFRLRDDIVVSITSLGL